MATEAREFTAAAYDEHISPGALARGWEVAAQARRHARARRLARDVVELSRLERGREHADCAPLDLARLVVAVAADYPLLVIDGPVSLPVSTDSRRLARILFVLLDNAQVHGKPPFTLVYDDRAITVCDAGPGFPPALLARATEPFVIADRVRARGLGLGLAIAARQAAVLGARLELGNRPEGGAQAIVRFTP